MQRLNRKRLENTSCVKSLCKKVWCPRSEVQCLNCSNPPPLILSPIFSSDLTGNRKELSIMDGGQMISFLLTSKVPNVYLR